MARADSVPSIALFFPTFTPGGIERCFLNLAEGFLERGIAVDIVVADRRGSFESQIPDGVRVIDLRAGRVLKSIVPMIKYLRRYSPDVLLSGHTHANIVAVWSTKLSFTDTQVAIGVHSTPSLKKTKNGNIISAAIDAILPVSYRMADHIIAVSKGSAKDISNVTGITESKISVIYNPVIGPNFDIKISEPIEHQWLQNDRLDVIIAAGRLAPVKDFQTLIQAFKIIEETFPDTRLIIMGTGEQKGYLEDLIKKLGIENKVDLIGYINNVYPYLNRSDVFALSSRLEGFGIALVEAMATGTPVVSTDCPNGPAEILQGGEFGTLTPVGDETALASAIENTLLDPIDSIKLVNRAMDFEQSVIVNEYLSVLFN
ncbi:glycosyltransferase [Natronocalculus amylovorans]|uniref:Glycosyltransferase n=1 Tax=Natronocalculus amylovorans TaxID=2917812 RepID=A0AAE3K9D9_9EURY|nr:glycosyltransferase [Natronocalculus amylovorans]MCL9817480.1 glycosyltransferase [Natronocalculus amylovorans]